MKIALKMMLVSLSVIATVTLLLSWFLLQQQEAVFVSRAEEIAGRFASRATGSLSECTAAERQDMLSRLNDPVPITVEYRSRWVWFDEPSEQGGPALAVQIQSLTAKSPQSYTMRDDQGHLHLYSYIPIETSDRRMGGVEFVQSMDQLQLAHADAMRAVWLLAGAIMVASTIAVGIASLHFLAHPLQLLTDKIASIAGGNLNDPLEVRSGDELGKLADGINAMCVRLKTSQEEVANETAAKVAAIQQLRHEDRLRTVGRLASGIAHELGTPLNVIQGRAQLIKRNSGSVETGSNVGANADQIIHESQRMASIIRQLLDFARRDKPRRSDCSLGHLAAQTVDLLQPLAQRAGVEIEYHPTNDEMAMVDANQIQQVITNLLTNAIDACDGDGMVKVNVFGCEGFSCIEVSDDGQGIEKSDLEQIFEPFFTTKDVGEGTGLGLSIANRIIQEHGGRIEVESTPGQGTMFTIMLPETTLSRSEVANQQEQC